MADHSTILELNQTDIRDSDVETIGPLLGQRKVLKLDLTRNHISSRGAEVLASSLSNSGLRTLLLGRNEIGSNGASSIARALKSPKTSINILDFRMNKIDDYGLKAIADALPASSIKWLALSGNTFTVDGIRTLCEALPSSQVKYLSLGACGLKNDAIEYLAKAAAQATRLESLDLRHNVLVDDVGSLFEKQVRGNPRLKAILLEGTRVPERQVKALARELACSHNERTQIMTILCSVRTIPRFLGAKIGILPVDILRLVAKAL